MRELTDNIFLQKLIKGDHTSWSTFFMKYFPKIKFFIKSILKDEMVAEELSQDVFTQIWTNKEHILEIRALDSYIYKMAKNAALQYLNRQYLENKYISSNTKKEENKYNVEDDLFAKETKLLIQLTVEQMPKQRRLIFEMSRSKYLKNSEIAKILDISPKTVENHLTLALRQIREALNNIKTILF